MVYLLPLIAANYLKGFFLVDLASSFPMEVFLRDAGSLGSPSLGK